jgi:hypothetical protein
MHHGFSHLAADWINRLGLFLGFLAFWFAAPELIGEERLKRWEKWALEDFIRDVPKNLGCLVSFSVACLMAFSWLALCLLLPDRILTDRVVNVVAYASPIAVILAGIFLQSKAEKLLPKFTQPLLASLANNERLRARSLLLGAFLFTLGFILTFAATFQAETGPEQPPRPEVQGVPEREPPPGFSGGPGAKATLPPAGAN